MQNYRVKEIHSTAWQEFLHNRTDALFVQSDTFGEVHKALGDDYLLLGIFDDTELRGGALVLRIHAKRSNFLYIPYGPVIARERGDWGATFSALTQYLSAYAKANGYDFIRISPFLEDSQENNTVLSDAGYQPAPMHMLAENTWMLPLDKTLEDIKKDMKKNHRNLVNRLEKEGVTVTQRTDVEALNRLNEMHDVVAKRHQFHRFSRQFVETEFFFFAKKGEATIFESRLPNGQVDASAIIIFYNGMACYRHSASLNHDKRLPTSYFIQWKVIEEAKKRGMRVYNFWGIAPPNASSKHPFYGITHFKKGFGGIDKNLIHCQDYPISKKYWVNWVLETYRRKRRGFSY